MAGLDGPRWPLSKSISPTAMKMFGQCPRKARLRYIDHVPVSEANSIVLNNGNVAHNLLKHQAYQARAGRAFAPDDWIYSTALRRLYPPLYATDEERELHARDILRWVRFGMEFLDPGAEYLKIEQGDSYDFAMDRGTHYQFYGRPDVVMLRVDADGEQFLEFIDYKTGKRHIDDLTPLLTRFAFTRYIVGRFGSTSGIRMVFTWPWLDEGRADQIELDRSYYEQQWPTIAEGFRAMVAEREWPARPSKLCTWCPFRDRYCEEVKSTPA